MIRFSLSNCIEPWFLPTGLLCRRSSIMRLNAMRAFFLQAPAPAPASRSPSADAYGRGRSRSRSAGRKRGWQRAPGAARWVSRRLPPAPATPTARYVIGILLQVSAMARPSVQCGSPARAGAPARSGGCAPRRPSSARGRGLRGRLPARGWSAGCLPCRTKASVAGGFCICQNRSDRVVNAVAGGFGFENPLRLVESTGQVQVVHV